MTVTVDSPFKSAARISKALWLEEVAASYSTPLWAGVPVEDRPLVAAGMYDLIVRSGHDPAIWLAIGVNEHSLGTNKDSVLWRNDTRSLTNARTVRDPSLSGWKVIRDAVRRSDYVRYQTVADSLQDGLYRVDEPGYAYRKAKAVSILDHTMIWTEGDGPQYAAKMVNLINGWVNEDTGGPAMVAQIPGFQWYPADSDHYERGRREKIRGGAQHYTAGTNSLDWLAKTSKPEVSVHFLVRHEPTLEDRGWQLVKIEDTAWTTAFANPYTVAIEMEHQQGQTLSDMAYTVLAQTWIDIATYVKANGLGEIPLNRTGIRGHREWVNNPDLVCPDGIDVDRIVRRIGELTRPAPPPAPPPPPDDDWPKVPVTERDPWRDANPWRKDIWIPRVFVEAIRAEGFMSSGYALTEAFAESDKIVQYFERVRWEIHRDGRITKGLVGYEALVCRYPERRP